MPTPIEQEPKPWEPCVENCAGCRTPTRFWTRIPERTPGEQIALCPNCAEVTEPSTLPTKREWCNKEKLLSPTVGSWSYRTSSPWAFQGPTPTKEP